MPYDPSQQFDLRPVAIDAGKSLSAVVDLFGERPFVPVGVYLPANWTSANLSFQVSVDGANFVNLYTGDNTELVIVAEARRFIPLQPSRFGGARFLMVRSGQASASVNQGTAVTLHLVVREASGVLFNFDPRIQQATSTADGLMSSADKAKLDYYITPPALWIAPTLLNGWVNVGAGTNPTGYGKSGGLILLRGLIKNGTANPLFTLPAGYRPANDTVLTTITYNGSAFSVGLVIVRAGGNVDLNVGANAEVTLDGMIFAHA